MSQHSCHGQLHDLLERVGWEELYRDKVQIDLNLAKEVVSETSRENWVSGVRNKPKLRTYCEIKQLFGTENYVQYYLPKKKRSLCAQIRSGILPLHIETGRWAGIDEEDRICSFCVLDEIENEIHFILHCPYYYDLRLRLFNKVEINVLDLCDVEIIAWLFEHKTFAIADFIDRAWARRQLFWFR